MNRFFSNLAHLPERVAIACLRRVFVRKFHQEWGGGRPAPHFFDQRHNIVDLGFGGDAGPYGFWRGFFVSEVLRDGDRLLDIGCGDGFFSRAFFASRCSQIDAIDIEPSAIGHAERVNAHPRITYYLRDAVAEPFPAEKYHVIVWDGAIGHFPAGQTAAVLEKAARSLEPEGVFAGSESLGHEGHDHLQFFEGAEDLAAVLSKWFAHVRIRTVSYRIRGGHLRREAFWRCSQTLDRLADAEWRAFPESLSKN
jgi:SAM-dependent methyltransferase